MTRTKGKQSIRVDIHYRDDQGIERVTTMPTLDSEAAEDTLRCFAKLNTHQGYGVVAYETDPVTLDRRGVIYRREGYLK